MFKKHQRWTALLVILTFAWLLQVSAMPLTAAITTEQAASASVDQAPGFVEQLGPDQIRRVKITPVLIIIAAALALAIISAFIQGFGREAAPREGMSTSEANRKKSSIPAFMPI